MEQKKSKSKSRPTVDPKKATAQSSAHHSKNKKSPPEKPAAESSENWTIRITEGLSEKQAQDVKHLLTEIPEAYKGYSNRRSELGKALHKLQQVLATAGQNGRFKQCLDHLRIPKSTAYGLIKRHERIKDLSPVILQAADELAVDLGAPKVYSQFAELRFARQGLTPAKAKEIIEPLTRKGQGEPVKSKSETPKQREDKLFAYATKLYEGVAPGQREKELQTLMDRLTRFFSVKKEG